MRSILLNVYNGGTFHVHNERSLPKTPSLPFPRRTLIDSTNLLPLTSIRIRRRRQWLIRQLLLKLLFITALTELIDSRVINFVLPSLVQIDEEDDIVSEGGETVEHGHFDGEGEEVIDEGVEEFVGHCSGRHVCYALEGA